MARRVANLRNALHRARRRPRWRDIEGGDDEARVARLGTRIGRESRCSTQMRGTSTSAPRAAEGTVRRETTMTTGCG